MSIQTTKEILAQEIHMLRIQSHQEQTKNNTQSFIIGSPLVRKLFMLNQIAKSQGDDY